MIGIDNAADMRNIMSAVSAEVDENKLIESISAIRNQKDNYSPIQDNKMENNEKTISTPFQHNLDSLRTLRPQRLKLALLS